MGGSRLSAEGSRHAAIVLDDSSSSSSSDAEQPIVEAETSSKATPFGVVTTMSIRDLLSDRAQMERERLARQRKRERDAGMESVEADKDKVDERPAKIIRSAQAKVMSKPENQSTSSEGWKQSKASYYWKGTIKKSFNTYSATAPGTRFEEFIRPTTPFRANGLTHVVMATYCEDIQWLSSMFPKGADAPEITMITLSSGELRPGVYAPLHPDLPNWVRLVVPRKGLTEWTTMHMKFLLLFYEDRLRFILLSGNMVDYDWSRIENTAFIHDFPKLADGKRDDSSSYSVQLRRILSSLSVPQGHFSLRSITAYDLNSKSEAYLVASIPTTTPISGWAGIEELGLGRLAKVVRDLLQEPDKLSIELEAQGSSMGNYAPRWLQLVHMICSGVDYKRYLPLPSGAKANKVWATATGCKESEKWPPIRLLFPSDKWVKTQSIEGVPGAGTFFGKSKAAVEKGFVELLHQPESVRGNVMMHHKAILALKQGVSKEKGTREEDGIIGWAYMGSHNLTQAAWGNISQPKQGKEPQLSVNNWELGIVVPIRRADLRQADHALPVSMAANIITWKRPVHRYGKDDIPWDQFAQ